MATEEKTTLPHFRTETKDIGQGLNGSLVDFEAARSYRRRKGLRWALAGTIITCLILRVIPLVAHKQFGETFQLHPIPPKAAEEIFM